MTRDFDTIKTVQRKPRVRSPIRIVKQLHFHCLPITVWSFVLVKKFFVFPSRFEKKNSRFDKFDSNITFD